MRIVDSGSTAGNNISGRKRAFAALLMAGVGFAALAPDAAMAQAATTAAAAQTPAADTSAAPDIVVTAQRREQKLKDVGIAITVLNAEQIKNLNINNATDIVRAIPNLRFNAYASSQVVFNMRGIAQNDYGDEQEPPVAVYQDDSYSSSMSSASFPIFDLARTEALRGPQGTLFGRNATGGAVQFISQQPTDHLDGYVSATYGSYNQAVIEGAISGRVAKDFDVRISGLYDRDDGYIKNVIPGQANRGANNHWALRGIFQYTPSSDFKAKLTVRYTEADHERQAGMYALSPSCPNSNLQGENLAADQVCSYWSAYNGNTPGAIATGYYNKSVIAWQGGNPWSIAATGDPYVDRQFFGATLRLDAHVGIFDLVSVSDYQHLNKFYNEMGDSQPEYSYVQGASYTPGPCPGLSSVTCYAPGTIFYQRNKTNQYSQELRASTAFGKNYLVFGAFGMIIDGTYGAKYATPFDSYDPTVNFTQRTESYAFFAQDEFKFNDHWKLIGGVRYWHDHKVGYYNASEYYSGFNMHYGPDGISFNDPTGTTTGGTITATPADARPNFSGATVRAEIDYKPSTSTLIYASYNRGSKSGGFTFSTGTPVLGQAVYDTINGIAYRPETLNDYEIGIKTSLPMHSSFNVAAYYYDYHNYQAFVQSGYTQVVRNLPAKAGGIEAEFTTHPIPGLTLQASGSWEQSHVSNVLLPDGVTLVRHDLPQAPEWSGSALIRYEFPLAGGNASVQADGLFQSSSCFTVLCAPVERESGYTVENLRFGFTPKGTQLDLSVFVNNVFNRAYRSYAYDGSLYFGSTESVYARPRTWGITARFHFGN
ncbi:TonB-dependent receptor, plug [Novosphingobium nitrogenifigens DSM 19370]|uniref:TonB-dependent receptor, plug n=1 Tax=Novosphingobium nitrogenifigens DSM 19370 TaxID=983920 RepID=F1ZAU8_9SPHN|nr:TonB-dependent receptor [Novosphingobium nitrogenifigens]EGD58274.1 TonB-dependent receptor, plug [Novosphingobium nitrogenifigens DSM 19370]